MSRRQFMGIVVLGVVIVVATMITSWSLYQASQTGKQSREALCRVLLTVRARTLNPQPGDPPRTAEQKRRTALFYKDLIGLVKGCEIPPDDGTVPP